MEFNWNRTNIGHMQKNTDQIGKLAILHKTIQKNWTPHAKHYSRLTDWDDLGCTIKWAAASSQIVPKSGLTLPEHYHSNRSSTVVVCVYDVDEPD